MITLRGETLAHLTDCCGTSGASQSGPLHGFHPKALFVAGRSHLLQQPGASSLMRAGLASMALPAAYGSRPYAAEARRCKIANHLRGPAGGRTVRCREPNGANDRTLNIATVLRNF